MNRIVVVSGDRAVTEALEKELASRFDVVCLKEPQEAGAELSRQEPLQAVVADMDCLDVLAEVQRYHPAVLRILVASDAEREAGESLIPSAIASRVIGIPWPPGVLLAAIEHGGGRPRLLLADEDADVRYRIQSWLGDDYDIVFAADGEELLRQALSQRPDAVIASSALPRLSGESVAWVMKNHFHLQSIPVVLAATRLGDTQDIDAFLKKPYSREDLLEILDHVLPAAPARSSRAAPEDERRLTPRMTVQIPGRLRVDATEAEALIVSLSLGGCYAETDIAVDAGGRGFLSFRSPGGPFETECEVVRRGERLGRKGLGLRFTSLAPEAQAQLLRALADQALPPTVDPAAST